MGDYNRAAKAILKADFFVLAIGAGFSADSGLAVYKDIAMIPAYIARGLTYDKICQPHWINEPEFFYGWWGNCFNNYRQAIPHKGYDIVMKWKRQFFSDESRSSKELHDTLDHRRSLKEPAELPGPFFIYSSNVDALPIKAGFSPCELYEIHGNAETWQCSIPCKEKTWSAPKHFTFEVDPNTMLAADANPNADFTKNNGFVSNHPKCIFCGAKARPSILMFGDGKWVEEYNDMWYDWQKSVLQILKLHENKNVVIVEVGCGDNVPSVRYMSDHFLDAAPSQVSVIRINLDLIGTYSKNAEKVIGIKERGLVALTAIDAEIERILATEQKIEEEEEVERDLELWMVQQMVRQIHAHHANQHSQKGADGDDISDLVAAAKDITFHH